MENLGLMELENTQIPFVGAAVSRDVIRFRG